MRARGWLTLILFVTIASPATAQEVYGRVWNATAKRPLADAAIVVTCAGRSFRGKTDRNGVYRMRGPAKPSNCSVKVTIVGGATSTSFPLYVSPGRTRANFTLYRRGDRWLLVRR